MDYENLNSAILIWLQTSGIKIILIAVMGFFAQIGLTKASKTLLTSALSKHMTTDRSDAGRDKRINTIHQVLVKTINIIIFLVVLLMIFIELGINVTPILTGAGIIGIAIGFGAQDMVKNIFHGIFILTEDQYSEDDIVTIAGVTGTVETFDLRRTILRDLDGTQHHIPNGEIAIASNKTKGWSGINLNIGIAYDTDLKKLKQIIEQVGQELKNENENITEAPKMVGVEEFADSEFADSAIIVKIVGKTKPGTQWTMARQLREKLKEVFDKEGIEIPFPHQVEIHKNN